MNERLQNANSKRIHRTAQVGFVCLWANDSLYDSLRSDSATLSTTAFGLIQRNLMRRRGVLYNDTCSLDLAGRTTREVMFTHDRFIKYQLCTTLAKLARHSQQTVRSLVQCCFTYTEKIRTVRDGEPRTSTSTFTQLLGLFKFNVALRPQRPYGLLGTVSPERPPRLSHST